ncbi:MAG TPA: hypothetical protein PK021_02090 [Dokdonella sp.]|nr:hypothetical protein [Dokdonella sp.]
MGGTSGSAAESCCYSSAPLRGPLIALSTCCWSESGTRIRQATFRRSNIVSSAKPLDRYTKANPDRETAIHAAVAAA